MLPAGIIIQNTHRYMLKCPRTLPNKRNHTNTTTLSVKISARFNKQEATNSYYSVVW